MSDEQFSRPHDGPTLKIRLVSKQSWAYIGFDCGRVAEAIAAAYNDSLDDPSRGVDVIDAKWATPEPEWKTRGGGW